MIHVPSECLCPAAGASHTGEGGGGAELYLNLDYSTVQTRMLSIVA